jgi:hypothetical protein
MLELMPLILSIKLNVYLTAKIDEKSYFYLVSVKGKARKASLARGRPRWFFYVRKI